ncbi:MAG: hypothetical protein WBG46_07550 [Nonlabens sp.]
MKTIKEKTIKMKIIKKQILSTLACLAFALVSNITYAQNAKDEPATQRKGFLFEFVVGGGLISIEDSAGIQTFDKAQGTFVFPDLKFGYMLNERLAITAFLPGNIYEFHDNDRNFGAFIPSVQYWVKDRWWIHGGVGLAIDSPALYDIEDNINDDWNFGYAVMASTGYEIYKKKSFALNIQSKLVLGSVSLDGGVDRDALIFNVGLGFSWL